MMNTKFYYLRDKANKPLVTVCLATAANDPTDYYRGVSICSPKDNPVKRKGRQIALGRVFKAIHRQKEDDMVFRDEAFGVIGIVDGATFNHLIKSNNQPVLTPLEIRLLKKESHNAN